MTFPHKLTVFTNVFNEEYMLPFWLEHHRKIFDHGVVFDWHCTDSSMDIVRKMCPTWEIIKAPFQYFDAFENDCLLMSEEMKHEGYKMVLNTTEFLVSPSNVRNYLSAEQNSYYVCLVPSVLSTSDVQEPQNLTEFFEGIDRCCIGGIPITNRGTRTIHSWDHGHYSLGRHERTLPVTEYHVPMYVLWFGFYPWNEKFHKRKLQIKDKIPQSDYDRGSSLQHAETPLGNEYRKSKSLEVSEDLSPILKQCIAYSISCIDSNL